MKVPQGLKLKSGLLSENTPMINGRETSTFTGLMESMLPEFLELSKLQLLLPIIKQPLSAPTLNSLKVPTITMLQVMLLLSLMPLVNLLL
jgi:hypothetical protein